MAKSSKIRRAGLEGPIRALAAKGMATRDISAALAEQEGVKIGHVSVARFLREETDDRREAAKHVAVSVAHETIPLATKALRGFVAFALKGAEAALKAKDHSASARLISAGTQAAVALHKLTMGEETPGDVGTLGDRLAAIVAARSK